MIYLLHSTVSVGTEGRNAASHYLGYCEESGLANRFREHQSGASDVAIIRAFKARGGRLLLAKVWPGKTRDEERKMKRHGHFSRLCPICQEAKRGHH